MLKLEADKYYKLRNGLRYYVYFVRQSQEIHPSRGVAIGSIVLDDGTHLEQVLLHDAAGKCINNSETYDILGEWKPFPVKVSGYINVYQGWTSGIFPTKEEADNDYMNKRETRVACVYVTGTEQE